MATISPSNRLAKNSPRPLRTLNLITTTGSIKPASMKRKSAVELLEESKAFYVKSERVLDAKQELPHSDHFRIRAPPLGLPPKGHDSPSHVTHGRGQMEQMRDEWRAIKKLANNTGKCPASFPDKRQLAVPKEEPAAVSAMHGLWKKAEDSSPRFRRVSSVEVQRNPPLTPPVDRNRRSSHSVFSGGPVSLESALLAIEDSIPPELPNRINRNLLTPPPVPPKSPGLRLKQAAHLINESPSENMLVCTGTSPPREEKVSYKTTARLNVARSLFLHKSLPELTPDKEVENREQTKLKTETSDASCSDCGSSGMTRSDEIGFRLRKSNSNGSSSWGRSMLHRRSRSTAGDRTTSDYASRSPSFKHGMTVSPQTTQAWSSQSEETHKSKPEPVTAFSLCAVHLPQASPMALRSDGNLPEELEVFFDSCGQLGASSQGSGYSTPVYFSSVSSVDSLQRKPFSDGELEEYSGMINGRQPGVGEPSVVEKNARIIKWLINCRKTLPSIKVSRTASLSDTRNNLSPGLQRSLHV